jgi:hypothetical protein
MRQKTGKKTPTKPEGRGLAGAVTTTKDVLVAASYPST